MNPSRFRSNAYPTATVDHTGRLYVAWSERGFAELRPNTTEGDARVVLITSKDGQHFSDPFAVDDDGQAGHQLMPTIAFAGGRLMLVYYDVRETRAQNFGKFVEDDRRAHEAPDDGHPRRDGHAGQSAGLRAVGESLGLPHGVPQRERALGTAAGESAEPADVQAGHRALHRRLHRRHRRAGVRAGRRKASGNTTPRHRRHRRCSTRCGPTTATCVRRSTAIGHDTRRPPLRRSGRPASSIPTQAPPVCVPGNAGSRNQNVYSSRITGGLVVGSPGNAKQLSPTLQRAFVVFAQNTTDVTRSFRMTIAAQPPGGRASFSQFPLPPFTRASPGAVDRVDVRVPPRSMAARSVYVTSTDPDAQIPVEVVEIGAPRRARAIAGRPLVAHGDQSRRRESRRRKSGCRESGRRESRRRECRGLQP